MNDKTYVQIGVLMEKHGLTNEMLAAKTGISVGTISGIRSGKNKAPSFDSICAIMKTMGESIDALVGESTTTAYCPRSSRTRCLSDFGCWQTPIIASSRRGGYGMRRYDRIMADIDAGLTDEQLARKYCYDCAQAKGRSAEFKNEVKGMHVYRMVHDGTLAKRGERTGWHISTLTVEDLIRAITRG